MFRKKKIAILTLIAVLVNLCSVSLSGLVMAAYTPVASGSEDYTWANVPIGAGGFVTGLAIHPTEPNLVYCRTDVGGVYRWDNANSQWIPLMDDFTYEWSSLYGTDGIALDPNNANVIYAACGGTYGLADVLKSTDRGNTWQRTNCPGAVFDANGEHRGMGECIAVDPNNSNIVYVGTYNKGLWRTTDGGSSWQQVYSSTSPMRNVIFDKASKSNGNTRVYAGIVNGGLIKSENGGSSWTKVNGAPAKINRMAIKSDGSVLYAAADTGVFKYTNNTWTQISPSGNSGLIYNAITIDASNENNLMCLGPHTKDNYMQIPMWYSTDGGSSWTNKTETSYLSSTLSWDRKTNKKSDLGSNAHDLLIDPHNSSRVWMSDWFGVYKTDNIKNGSQYWNFLYQGMEEVCPRKVITPERGTFRLIAGIADMDGAVYKDYKKYPDRRIRTGSRTDWPTWKWMMSTADIDYCIEDPSIVVRVGIDWDGDAKAEISTNGTESWRNIIFTKTTGGEYDKFSQFGQVAVSATKHPDTGKPVIVVIPAHHVPIISYDLGSTWEDVSGITDTTISTKYWDRGRHLASDKVNGSKFYIQDRNPSTPGSANINMSKTYVSEDWGKTWTSPTMIGTKNVSWHVDQTQIKAAPYMEGEVWSITGDRKLYRSTNGGKSFTAFTNITNVDCFSFGKNAPDRTNPTVYACGTVGTTKGIYRSIDMGASWCKINVPKSPSGCTVNDITGDLRTFGVVFVSTGGRGMFYGEPVNMPEETPAPEKDWENAAKKSINEPLLYNSSDFSGDKFTISEVKNEQYAAYGMGWAKIDYSSWGDEGGQYIYDKYIMIDSFTYKSNQLNVYGGEASMVFCCKDENNYYKVSMGSQIKLSKVVDGEETVLGTLDENVVSKEISIQINRSADGTIRVYKGAKGGQNMAEIFNVVDNDLFYGYVGLKSEPHSGGYFANLSLNGQAVDEENTPTAPPSPSPSPTPMPTPVPTKDPAKSTKINVGNLPVSGESDWSGEGYTQTKTAFSTTLNKQEGQYIYEKHLYSDDYEYVAERLQIRSGSAGMLFSYLDENNYYKLVIGEETKLIKVVCGQETELATSSESTNSAMSIKIRRSSDGLIVVTKGASGGTGEGTELFRVKDTSLTYGKIGLESSLSTAGFFSNLYAGGTILVIDAYTINGVSCRNTTEIGTTVMVNLTKEEDKDGELFVATYDASGRLCGLNHEPTSGDEEVGSEFEQSINIPLNGQETMIKAFVWESLETAVPVSKIYTFDLAQ